MSRSSQSAAVLRRIVLQRSASLRGRAEKVVTRVADRQPVTTPWHRLSGPIALGLTVLALVIFAFFIWTQFTDPRYAPLWSVDRITYREAGLRVLAGGQWFLPEQVTGQPYEVTLGHVMYPPVAMLWLVPAALLPDLLWWAIPLAVIAIIVVRHRPSMWGWAGIAACLAYPPTSQMLVSGNPGLWIAAAAAIGSVWPPAYALIFAKPSLFPFAFLGARDRGWWLLVGAGVALSIATLPLTLEWISALTNARGLFSGPLYGFRDLGWLLIPLIASRTTGHPTRGATS